MRNFLDALEKAYPSIKFESGNIASWSARTSTITFLPLTSNTQELALLHEVAHSLLEHKAFTSDIDLLSKEVAAWDKTRTLVTLYGVTFDKEHVEDCLDTYRDWLYKRSTCPQCNAHGLQRSSTVYTCLNCSTIWNVTQTRLCRPYRLQKAQKSTISN